MQDDRARLAVELDGALARANRLDRHDRGTGRRIDRAIGSVRAVIESDQRRESRPGREFGS